MNERIKMPIEERAKQFAPFSALTDLGKALKEKEQLKEKLKPENTEEM
ncbi:MAG: hypothetical protein Q4B40_07095 [Clostridia bacterium]|nr:hypothetical protein [Clostridia bacterium]